MTTLLMAALSAGVGLGLLVVVAGFRGVTLIPSVRLGGSDTSAGATSAWLAGATLVGAVVFAVTGWIGAALGMTLLVLVLPRFLGGGRAVRRELEQTQAIATWAEMIRDNMAGAAGLEQALQSTADIAPDPIAVPVKRFSVRLDAMPVTDALILLGRDLRHPAADLVVVSLANAARMEGRDLGGLLTRLADAIRGEVRMRQRVEVGRARVRTSSRIVLAVTLATAAMIYFTSRDLLAVYDSFSGQLWLAAVFALFIGALWAMNHYARIELPERFTAREVHSGPGGGTPPSGAGVSVGGSA
jgi:Flp pilus assembly protein TadB